MTTAGGSRPVFVEFITIVERTTGDKTLTPPRCCWTSPGPQRYLQAYYTAPAHVGPRCDAAGRDAGEAVHGRPPTRTNSYFWEIRHPVTTTRYCGHPGQYRLRALSKTPTRYQHSDRGRTANPICVIPWEALAPTPPTLPGITDLSCISLPTRRADRGRRTGRSGAANSGVLALPLPIDKITRDR